MNELGDEEDQSPQGNYLYSDRTNSTFAFGDKSSFMDSRSFIKSEKIDSGNIINVINKFLFKRFNKLSIPFLCG